MATLTNTPSQAPVVGLLAPLLPAIVASILPVFLIGALVGPMGSEFGYQETTAGWLMASFFGVSALVSRRAGAISDSVGPVTTLQVGLTGSALTAAAMATVAGSVPVLAVAMMVGGGCNALTQVAANVYLADTCRRPGTAWPSRSSSRPTPAACWWPGCCCPPSCSPWAGEVRSQWPRGRRWPPRWGWARCGAGTPV